ncbi:MAG: SNF2 family DNA or RNA helicase, partial [Bacteroidia bacterium]
YESVYSVVEHPYLGFLIEGYVVQLTSAGNLSLVHQKIHGNNADFYDKKLDANDYEALRLLDECTPEFIIKKFSPKKRIRPKEYFDKYFDHDLFKKAIRPFIERRIAKAIQLIKGKKLYVSELKNIIYHPIDWTDEVATVLFHLRKNPDNTHYFATIKHLGQRVHFSRHNAILLSREPCYLIVGNKLLLFDAQVDGNKLEPFLRKKFIQIPAASEEKYFRKFVVPLIEQYSVYAVGIEIRTEKFVASPILQLSNLLDGTTGALLKFNYGSNIFPYHSDKYVSVSLSQENGIYVFTRIKRSKQWEEIKKDTLALLGLVHQQGSEFKLGNQVDDYEIIEWVVQNADSLEKAGFVIDQNFKDVFTLELAQLRLEVDEERDWFDVKADVVLGGFKIPFAQLRKHILSGKRVFLLPDGKQAVIPLKWIEQMKGLAEFTISEEHIHLEKHHVGLLQPIFNPDHSTELKEKLHGFAGIEEAALPKGFVGKLRPYQKAGYDWMHFLRHINMGGVLADDMGLGKTVQALAFLQYLKENPSYGNLKSALNAANLSSNTPIQQNIFGVEKKQSTCLLCVPTSLIYNWIQEAKKFAPSLEIYQHVGIQRATSAQSFSHFDLVITTYGTVRNDIEIFKTFTFNLILLDESQFIKNPTSKLAKNITQIPSNQRITLTGTPIENTVVDLWSQMNFINPGMLGSHKSFVTKFANPIEKQHDVEKTNLLHHLIKPFVMRRTKMQVADDLPSKTEQVVYCNMTDEQADVYEKTKSTYRNLILDSIQKLGMGKSRIHLLSGLTKLRQIANHPVLCNPEYEHQSGKFEQVVSMLETALEEDHKVLMFSQFVGHLQLYVKWLNDQNIGFCYLDGSTPAKQRNIQVKSFQEDSSKRVFVISLKAGGFGLNLTAADYVFMLDPWWNPAAEAQAIDRTHRIGQTQRVFSYKFVTGNTVEDKIVKLQEHKKNLSSSLIKTEESYLKQLTSTDIEQLFD